MSYRITTNYLIESKVILIANKEFKKICAYSSDQSVSMSWCRAHSGTCDQILLPVGRFLFESCGLVSVEHPSWREDGSAVCKFAVQSLSCPSRAEPVTLLSHLRLPKPGGPGSRIYIPQEQGDPVRPRALGF
jgi:hypothetical protein